MKASFIRINEGESKDALEGVIEILELGAKDRGFVDGNDSDERC
jgi:hypothetical protein